MSYRKNLKDREQDVLEAAQYDGGVPVQVEQKTRVIAKGVATMAEKKLAGVIVTHDDKTGRFLSDTQGKA